MEDLKKEFHERLAEARKEAETPKQSILTKAYWIAIQFFVFVGVYHCTELLIKALE